MRLINKLVRIQLLCLFVVTILALTTIPVVGIADACNCETQNFAPKENNDREFLPNFQSI